jgi:murein tripeptide amidase MpaA
MGNPTMDFNRYFKNDELEAQLGDWAQSHGDLVTLESIGQSHEGRPIWLLTLTNRETGPDRDKPAVWIDANIHSVELAGTTTALHITHTLLSGYGNDDQATRLLDTSTFYILPRVNPDGAEQAMAENPHYLRSGTRSYPWEEKAEGLHRQDVDGDGRILQMRISDPNGDWKVSSLDPRLMEKRAPDEQGGDYYRLLPEGLLEDYDGYIVKIAPPHQGLDFNRNFPAEWKPENDQSGAGPYPASEPEIKALMNFVVDHPNINLALTYHTSSGVILRPSSFRPDDKLEVADLFVYKKIGQRGTELVDYPNVSVYHDYRYHPKHVIVGAFDDWAYDHLGVFSFTIELWDIIKRSGIEERKFIEWFRDHPHEDDHKILKWVDENAGEDAYVDWYEFDHPQLGPVELGGWNMIYTWTNPPHSLMGEEAARNTPFALALGDMLPRLSIHTLETTALGEDTHHLNLVVENSGFLPTYTSKQGKKRGIMRPVRVELELPEGGELLNGKLRTELGHLEGRSNKLAVSHQSTSPTDNRARAEWTLRAPAGATVKVNVLSERAGTVRRELALG